MALASIYLQSCVCTGGKGEGACGEWEGLANQGIDRTAYTMKSCREIMFTPHQSAWWFRKEWKESIAPATSLPKPQILNDFPSPAFRVSKDCCSSTSFVSEPLNLKTSYGLTHWLLHVILFKVFDTGPPRSAGSTF